MKKLVLFVLVLFAFGCSGKAKDYIKLMNLLIIDEAKSDVIKNCRVDFSRITYIDKKYLLGGIDVDDEKEFLGDNAFYGKNTVYHKGKVLYSSLGALYEASKGIIKEYSFTDVKSRDLGKGIFYYKEAIYFFRSLGKEFPPTGKFFLSKYHLENGESKIEKVYDLKEFGFLNGKFLGLEKLKIHTCLNDKLYISFNISPDIKDGQRGLADRMKTIILLYNLKTGNAEKIGDYDFNSYFRIVYAGSKVIVVTDMFGIYAINLSDGKIIYEKSIDLMSPLVVPGRKAVLYNRAVFYNKALYLIIPIKKEKATKIVKIDKNGEKIVGYFPSIITLVARDKSKIFFVKAGYLLDASGGYNLQTSQPTVAKVVSYDLEKGKEDWQKSVKVKLGGGLGAPLLTKDKVIVCLGGKIIILNRVDGKIQKIIPLKGHFSARLSFSENRITCYGKTKLLIIGENQKRKEKRYKNITFYRNGEKGIIYRELKKKNK